MYKPNWKIQSNTIEFYLEKSIDDYIDYILNIKYIQKNFYTGKNNIYTIKGKYS